MGEAPEFVWPTTSRSTPAKIVYLDLNHWVGLAKADVGHADGAQFGPVLAASRQAKAEGKATFPLSAMHYIELSKIERPRQRSDLAKVIEELSEFTTLVDLVTVKRSELRALLLNAGLITVDPSPILNVLGYGVGFSVGEDLHPKILDKDGSDLTQRLRSGPRGRAFVDAAWAHAERAFLVGPKNDEVARLQALGWDPRAGWTVAERRAKFERDQVSNLDKIEKPWRKGRLLDIIAGREVMVELRDPIEQLLRELGSRSEKEKNRIVEPILTGIRRMPSTEVSMALKSAMHRDANRARNWKANDVVDMDAMSLAVPYCDIVVTEKASHEVLTAAHLDARAGTIILRNLVDLTCVLA